MHASRASDESDVCEKDLELNKTFRLLLAPNYWMHCSCHYVMNLNAILNILIFAVAFASALLRLCHHSSATTASNSRRSWVQTNRLKTKRWLSLALFYSFDYNQQIFSKNSAKIIYRTSLHLSRYLIWSVSFPPTTQLVVSSQPIQVFQVRVKVNKNACFQVRVRRLRTDSLSDWLPEQSNRKESLVHIIRVSSISHLLCNERSVNGARNRHNCQ